MGIGFQRQKPFEVMQTIEEGRARFSNFSPLAERTKHADIKIISIGEFFGGTTAFDYKTAFLGARELIAKEKIDLICINGGVLPEVPARGTRANVKKHQFLINGIETMNDACEVMRKPMKQLIGVAREIPIVYVMGEEDRENIQIIMDRKIAESKKAENIKARIAEIQAQKNNVEERVVGIKEELDSFASEIKAVKEQKVKAKKTRKLDVKLQKKLEQQLRNCLKSMKELRRKKEELLQREQKMQERVVLLQDDLENLGAVRRTNIAFLTPGETKEFKSSAKKEYLDLLNRLFEGAKIHILEDNYSLLNLKGLRADIGHIKGNTSKVAKSNALVEKQQTQAKMQIYGLLPAVDISLFSHNPGTKLWSVPQTFASDNPTYIFQQGGFSDPKALFDAYNKGIKIPQTEALANHQLDSGLTLIHVHKDGAIEFKMIGRSMLAQYARPKLLKEHKDLMIRLRKMRKKSEDDVDPINIAQASLTLPSKLPDSHLHTLLESKGIDAAKPKEAADKMIYLPPKREIREIKMDFYTDTHLGIGNMRNDYSNQELMNAAIKDSKNLSLPEIIVFGGDMVEGDLGGSKANEYLARTFVDEYEFERLLKNEIKRDKTLGDLDYQRAMMEFHKRSSYAYTIPNIDEQINRLMPLIEYAAEVVARGGDAILISGNHYNQSDGKERYDEAIRLESMIRTTGGFRKNHPNIHIFYGGWIGSGQVTVKGIPILGMHKGKPSTDKVTGLMEHKVQQRRDSAFLILQGHHHDMSAGTTIADAYLSGPSIAPMIPYVDQAAMHGGLRGYTRATLYADQNDRHFESLSVMNRYVPQLERYLEKLDSLYLKVYNMMVKKTDKS